MSRVFDRRRFVLSGGALFAARLAPAAAARAASGARVGFLSPLFLRSEDPVFGPFLKALGARHYVEGDTLAIEYRSAEGKMHRLGGLADELVRLPVDLIVAVAPPAIEAARRATKEIPIVMAFSGDDPVRSGFVASLARPGGNVTGLTILAPDLSVKRLELMREIAPSISRVAVLANPANRTSIEQLSNVRAAARALGIRVDAAEAREPAEIDGAIAALAGARPQMLLVLSDPLFFAQRRRIARLAAERRLPMMSDWKETAQAGALIAYGPNLAALADRAAEYVDRILKGAKPAELPVEQPRKFDLTVNLKTARALGLTIPQSLLLRADEVFE